MFNDYQLNLTDDLLWGAKAIAEYIGRTRSQTYWLINSKAIPAKKLGSRTIVARRSELDRALARGLVEGAGR